MVTGTLVAPGGELVVISGRYRGRHVPLQGGVVRIGRDRGCEVPLDDEAASRVHSEIICRGGDYLVRDLESTNGTFLNDARVAESRLRNGDRICIGDTVLLVQLRSRRESHATSVVFGRDEKELVKGLRLSLADTRFLKEEETSLAAQRQFSFLYEFMGDIAGILNQSALLERALFHFFRAFAPDRGVVLLLTPEGEPGTQATRVREGLQENQSITISRALVRHLLEKKESFLSVNATETRLSTPAEGDQRVLSIIGAPLRVKDKVLGLVYLDTQPGGRPFSEENVKLCTAMALQLAVCLENTRLYAELLDAAEFNNSLLRSLTSGLLVVDATGQIVRVNRATEDILGQGEVDLLGRTLSDFPELAELGRILKITLETAHPQERHEILVRPRETPVPLGVSTSVLTDQNGAVSGAMANFRSLAAIRKLEDQVRRSQHLAGLGQMAAGVAHEIRNPLNSIRGFAQLLQELPASDARQAEWTQIILEEVDRMNTIVQDLLDFSRQRELTLVPVLLEDLLSTLVHDMQNEAAQAQVSLELQPCAQLPSILGHRDKLRQVYRNMILNGMQSCKAGGRVSINLYVLDRKLPPTEAQTAQNASQRDVAVAIEDSGCGIHPAHLSKIFDPFFTQKEKGTGLGLSICQKIIEQHGGRIEVKSQVGTGSVFTVLLPTVNEQN